MGIHVNVTGAHVTGMGNNVIGMGTHVNDNGTRVNDRGTHAIDMSTTVTSWPGKDNTWDYEFVCVRNLPSIFGLARQACIKIMSVHVNLIMC
jgi:hypothetical protein